MSGSGLEELWECFYAKGSVSHMMTGHVYSRALRAHFLTQVSLAQLLLTQSGTIDKLDKDHLLITYNNTMESKDNPPQEPSEIDCVAHMSQAMNELCDQAATTNGRANYGYSTIDRSP